MGELREEVTESMLSEVIRTSSCSPEVFTLNSQAPLTSIKSESLGSDLDASNF
jgi:hypothetical protein